MKTVPMLALAALLLASSAWADSTIYKWVDAQGVVHYGTEPHGDSAKPIGIVNTGNSLPNAGAAAATTGTAPAAASASPAANAISPADAALLQATPDDSVTCKSARNRLNAYLHSEQLYKTDDKGQKQLLSKADQDTAIDLARAYVRQSCVPGGQR